MKEGFTSSWASLNFREISLKNFGGGGNRKSQARNVTKQQ